MLGSLAGATGEEAATLAGYVALGLLSATLASGLAVLTGWALARFVFDQGFAVPALPLLTLAACVVGLTLLVGFWGGADVYRRTPAEVLRAD